MFRRCACDRLKTLSTVCVSRKAMDIAELDVVCFMDDLALPRENVAKS